MPRSSSQCAATAAPFGKRQFAGDQIDGLNAVGAFIDRRDPRIAKQLRRAGFLDIAHAAMHLHAERGDLVGDVGRKRLGHRREQRSLLMRGVARGVVSAAFAAIDRHRGGVTDGARGLRERAHGQQHAPHVGMGDDRRHLRRFHAGGAALPAVARIGERLLRRALGDADALQADGEPRAVHHGEHAGHAGVFLADQKSDGAGIVAENHGAGRRAVDAELVLDRMGADVVARAERAVGVAARISAPETAKCRACRAAHRAGAPARNG